MKENDMSFFVRCRRWSDLNCNWHVGDEAFTLQNFPASFSLLLCKLQNRDDDDDDDKIVGVALDKVELLRSLKPIYLNIMNLKTPP